VKEKAYKGRKEKENKEHRLRIIEDHILA